MTNDIDELIEALLCLPSVGPRSAQRMAYHLLLHKRKQGVHLAERLKQAMTNIKHCQYCNTFSCEAICSLCSAGERDTNQICIVETPLDLLAIEKTSVFNGQYFVLMGLLSPIDGIGPDKLSIDKLLARCQQLGTQEVIFATNSSMEGEATVYYLQEQLTPLGVCFSQLARGVPMGGALEYLDSSTISRALSKRSIITDNIS